MGHERGRRVEEKDKEYILALVVEARKNGCRIKIACSDLEITFNTYMHWENDKADRRRGPLSTPANKLSVNITNEILSIASKQEFVDLSPWIIVAKLADQGKYIASESSFYKVLKEKKLLAHRGKSAPRTHKRPIPLVATGPNQIWSWDITYLKTDVHGRYLYLYLFMDIYSRKIVGFDICESESMENSAKIFSKICRKENIKPEQLILHSDNGGAMKGATMLATMQKLGVIPSFSRPRVSDDNAYSEALFKTIKYHSMYPEHFSSMTLATEWVRKFIHWYNNEHFHSGIKFVTPSSRHLGLDKAILENRERVYLEAKKKYPERWNGRNVKNLKHDEKVFLNYLQKEKADAIQAAA